MHALRTPTGRARGACGAAVGGAVDGLSRREVDRFCSLDEMSHLKKDTCLE